MKSLLTGALAVLHAALEGLRWKPAFLVLVLAAFGQASAQEFRIIPVTLHSLLTADYSADAINMQFPILNLSIFLDTLGDHDPVKASGANATLQSSLLTPVASVTPMPGEVVQNPPTATPTPTLLAPSITASTTPTLTPTPTPSLTSVETETSTSQPSYTPQPTYRATLAPTKTRTTQNRPTSTQTFHPSPTPTKAPPTLAPTPTHKPPTATARPTATKPPHPYPGPTKPPYP
jgi:hypothetical protein